MILKQIFLCPFGLHEWKDDYIKISSEYKGKIKRCKHCEKIKSEL